MPPKNPPPSAALRKRCKKYLEETHHSEWNFTDFWNGDKGLLSGYGDTWLRALQKVAKTTDDVSRRLAAVAAGDKYKSHEHLPESSRGRKGKGKSKESSKGQKKGQMPDLLDPPEPPPSYEQCPQEEETHEAKPRNPYEQQHLALSVDRKWYLPSGRPVEDVLFKSMVSQSDEARRLGRVPRETYAHSYILDVDDPVIQALFKKEEWDVIVSLLLPSPTIDDSLESFMHKFADVKTAADLRHRLATTSYLPPDETYSRDKHGDQAWVHSALTSLVVLYELAHMSRTDNLEAWFQINIWGPIFDRCFQYIPKMSISRSESQSNSNSNRKNLTAATTATRKPIGSKYDGLITHNQIEYGAVEDSKEYQGEETKKWTSDSLKLAKVLHDQMRRLEVEVTHDRGALEGFRCVGFLTAGLHCQGLLLQYGKGHVCLLKRIERCTVLGSVSPLSSLFSVLVAVWQMREIVRKSIDNLAEFFLKNTEVLFRAAIEKAVCMPVILPTCFDTDGEL